MFFMTIMNHSLLLNMFSKLQDKEQESLRYGGNKDQSNIISCNIEGNFHKEEKDEYFSFRIYSISEMKMDI